MKLQDKRIVVTGGTGFLGSHLVDRLRAAGCEQVFPVGSGQYDLVDRGDTERMVQELRPDCVFHLAAQVGGIGANRDNPGKYFYDNLQMGLNVVETARIQGVEKVVIAGTICAYPKFAPVPFREDDLWNGYPEETNAPYGIAKKALLVMAQAYRQQYGMNAIVLFPVNLYGPRDNFDLHSSHVIPAMVRKCVTARERGDSKIVLWGDGSPTREFLYAPDAARGLVLAAEKYDEPDPVNLGTGEEISIADLARRIAELTGFSGEIVWDDSKPNGQPRRKLSTDRARERFGFEAETMLAAGLKETIAWYEAHREEID